MSQHVVHHRPWFVALDSFGATWQLEGVARTLPCTHRRFSSKHAGGHAGFCALNSVRVAKKKNANGVSLENLFFLVRSAHALLETVQRSIGE